MRTIRNFNQDWLFAPEKVDFDAPDDQFEAITLPHSNKLFSQLFVDNNAYQFVSTYRKRFYTPENGSGKRVFIDFDGAMLMSAVYINDELVGVHKGGYTPFSYDITELLASGENCVTV
jgi:beta-galactosidase